jgi:hypothetical protein
MRDTAQLLPNHLPFGQEMFSGFFIAKHSYLHRYVLPFYRNHLDVDTDNLLLRHESMMRPDQSLVNGNVA